MLHYGHAPLFQVVHRSTRATSYVSASPEEAQLEAMSRCRVPSSRAWWIPRFTIYDVSCALVAPWLAIMIRDDGVLTHEGMNGVLYAGIALVATLALLAYFRIGSDLSQFFSPDDAVQIAKASLGAAVLTAAVAFSVTRLDGIPRSLPAIHFFVLVFLLMAGRAVYRFATSKGEGRRPSSHAVENVVLVGTDNVAWFYIRALSTVANARQKIVAILDVDFGKVGRTLSGYTIIGQYAIAPELLDEMSLHGVKVNRFVVTAAAAAPGSAHWAELSRVCADRGVGLDFLPEQLNLIAASAFNADAAEHAIDRLQVGPGRYWRVKRGLDIAASLAGLFLLGPLFIVVGLLVACSLGFPLVFWQERLGRNAHPIHVHKFRTMRVPFDLTGRRRSESERETAIGRFLRALRLDELPQLLDILRGDMSLIGPRPLLPIDQPTDRRLRLSVRPGLTGWAQVHGGRLITPEEKNALDVWYIKNASLRLDIKILLLTARAVFIGDKRHERPMRYAGEIARTPTALPRGISARIPVGSGVLSPHPQPRT
jgi:lipopolysaccharide/colanic/teichoic acid biosynthesis glycosyltransferase